MFFKDVQVGHQQEFLHRKISHWNGLSMEVGRPGCGTQCSTGWGQTQVRSMGWEGFSNLDDSAVYKCLRMVFALG